MPLTERNSRLALGLIRKRPNKETESEDKLDVAIKCNKRTKEAT
ncbi:MAG: hypothetical protein RLZZ338_3486 [Cyanobacteriota bacterium]|jgi:hypothetical protein